MIDMMPRLPGRGPKHFNPSMENAALVTSLASKTIRASVTSSQLGLITGPGKREHPNREPFNLSREHLEYCLGATQEQS